MFDRFTGIQQKVVGEGTHFMVPWLQKPTIYSIRTAPRSIPTVTGTKDLQQVSLTLRVLYRPVEEKLPKIHAELGTDYNERVLPSITNEVLKAVVAQYEAEQLLKNREDVSKKIRAILIKRASDFNIILDDVSITHLTFSTEYAKAIEAKQVAQQDAERAQYLVKRAEQEQQAAIVRAEGDSEAAALISSSLRLGGTALLEIRRLEAAKEIAGALARSRNVVYLPGGNNNNMLLALPSGGGGGK
eukprot:JP436436.1.p1 GENE.JP436436.1~~JP436436.1.p1  ORF type:complete len:270 (-),score=86.73 JP436436.1:11-742(-)